MPALMVALGLEPRTPVPSEEAYLRQWMDWGFTPEMVALAYDRTVLKNGKLKWAYLNGILRRWHQEGLSSPQQVRQERAPAPQRQQRQQTPAGTGSMDKYVRSLHKKDKGGGEKKEDEP